MTKSTSAEIVMEPAGKIYARIKGISISRRDKFELTVFPTPSSSRQLEEETSEHQGTCSRYTIHFTEGGELLISDGEKEYLVGKVNEFPSHVGAWKDYRFEILAPMRNCPTCGK